MTPSLEGSPTKTKEAPFPHEVRLALLDTKPVFQCLRLFFIIIHLNMLLHFFDKKSGTSKKIKKTNPAQKILEMSGNYGFY